VVEGGFSNQGIFSPASIRAVAAISGGALKSYVLRFCFTTKDLEPYIVTLFHTVKGFSARYTAFDLYAE
jgi:hypothetical protein